MALISVMTEITVIAVPPALERFVLHWGDMGGFWGVNRSVGQIHALLYVASGPMTAEDIAESLGMARSNVSTSLRELQNWSLVRRVPVKGDRRDHFEAETDVWEIAARITARRKEREIDPALAVLRACVAEAQADAGVDPEAVLRLRRMLEFTETVDRWYAQMTALPRSTLMAVIRLGARIAALVPGQPKKKS
jgi:DNA-binding transcriptional regulator GbsR (MarR family)